VIQLEKDGVRWELVPAFAPLLDAVLKAPGETVKASRAKSVTRHSIGRDTFFIKRYLHHAVALRPLKFLFKSSQARQEWELALRCESRGVPIVRHLALGERWGANGLQESILVTEGFDGVPLDELAGVDPDAILKFVERLHDCGVLHEDLHPGNLLVRRAPFELRLVDLHGAKVQDRVREEERKQNLALLHASFPIPVSPEVRGLSAQVRQRLLFERSRRCLLRNREFARKRIAGLEWQVRVPFLSGAAQRILDDPDGFLKLRAQILKPGRTSTVGKADGLVLKRFNFRKLLNLVKDLGRHSRARRAYRHAYHLELLGLPTARAIATADRRVGGSLLRSYFLMEEIAGAVDLGVYLATGREPERAVIEQAARLVGRLHEEGFSHRDLKETNLVLGADGTLYLLDLDGLAFLKRVVERRAALDLLRLARGVRAYPGVTRRHRVEFLLKYCRVRELRRVPRLN